MSVLGGLAAFSVAAVFGLLGYAAWFDARRSVRTLAARWRLRRVARARRGSQIR